MQAITKVKTLFRNEAVKEVFAIIVGTAVGFKLTLTCFTLFGLSFGELIDTALGKSSYMWERSTGDVLCILALAIAFLGMCMVLVDTAVRVFTVLYRKSKVQPN